VVAPFVCSSDSGYPRSMKWTRLAPFLLLGLLSAGEAAAVPPPGATTAKPRDRPRRTSVPVDVSRSVVNVQVYRSRSDWSLPWRMQPVQGAMGSGFLIEGGRILTNAHVVADSRQVLVRRSDQADPSVASVVMVGNDCDLALLDVEDRSFLHGLSPLQLGDLPKTGTRVTTYGFPLGGQDVSSTAGIVSRVESRGYVHSGADQHLVVQTDAAINPGNSGGPVVQDGRAVGVAFQGYPGFDNMGFFIPTPVVRHFLENVKDGRYDGFPDSGLVTTDLLSPAYRTERRLPKGTSGVAVERILPGGSVEGLVLPGDVIVSVDGNPVANDGTISRVSPSSRSSTPSK
jgi:S1-C subfamily serine protease